MNLTVAIAQATPVVLDLAASVAKACDWIAEAGKRGAQLLAFPETWLPVYPFWCDAGTFGTWGHEPSKRLHARLARNSLVIPSKETEQLCRAARDARCAVALGANERDLSGSLYNSLLFISAEGEILGKHRKLVPTFGERLVWGYGDAAGLRAHDIAGARVGGLICGSTGCRLRATSCTPTASRCTSPRGRIAAKCINSARATTPSRAEPSSSSPQRT